MQLQQPTVGQLFAERYQIEKLLGKGGMGQVYLALDSLLEGAAVALKILPPEFTRDNSFLKRFLREIQLARQVTHPNVARTFEAGTFQGQLYFVMELVKGGELGQLLGRGGMPISHAIPIINQICDGLAAIHAVGVVHGDLKPANLMLATDGMVKITDFGIARNPGAQKSTEILGSPYYMAPEIWRGEGNSPRSDLYALGIIMFEILTGRRPFDGENDSNSMFHHLTTEPQRPSQLKSSIPEWMDLLILNLINKDPSQRPASINEVRETIEEATNGPKTGAGVVLEVHHQYSTEKNSTANESAEVLESSADIGQNGRVNNPIDNLQRSLMYNSEEIVDSPSERFFRWIASFDTEKNRGRLLSGFEAVMVPAIISWLLLHPVTSLQESLLAASSRSESSIFAIAAVLFTLVGVAALIALPLLIIGRLLLSRVQAATLWVSSTVVVSLFLSILFCLHLTIYSHLVDPHGLTILSQKALHSMRNVIAGCIQTTLLVPFNGIDNIALQSGFIEPSLNSESMSGLFASGIIVYYLLFGALIHLLLLRPLGKYIQHWTVSLPAIIPILVTVESAFCGLFTLDTVDRVTLPWIGTIQQTFPRTSIMLALVNWLLVYAYLTFLTRPIKSDQMPWSRRPGTQPLD